MDSEKKPRYIVAKEYLLEKIKEMKPGDNQLEPENLLTEKLGMSRETIRKAMSALIHEGIITRWHGKGNFGHPEVTNLTMRMDINSDFKRLLKNAGHQVKTTRTKARVVGPSPEMLKRMPEANDKMVVNFGQSFYADGDLAIQCRVELLRESVVKIPEPGEYTENINQFLWEHCSKESSHTTAWLKADHNEKVATLFGLPGNTPLLEWDEVYYDVYENRIGFVKIYFHPEIMDLSLLLKF